MENIVVRAKPRPRPHWLKKAWLALSIPFILFISLPLAALFVRLSPLDFSANLRQTEVLQAVQLSLVTSLCTVGITLLLGTPVAYMLSRYHGGIFRVIDTIIDLPTVLPPAVAGVALLMAFGRRGLLGGLLTAMDINIPFTQIAVIMAQTCIAAPLYIKAATLGLSSVDCELKKAAALDGATRWQTFRHIMVPMSWMSLLSGAVMTWARALGEFGATIIFAGNFPGRTQTMPLAIYIGFEIDLNSALTLAVILVGISFVTLIVVKWFLHTRMETASDGQVEGGW
jgi:molybdate transport system permease protein